MQPITSTTVRPGLSAAQLTALIKTDSAITVGAGLDLLNRNLDVIQDLSPYLESGTVARGNYNNLHGSFSFKLQTELSWGTALVRPYMILSNGTITAQYRLGAYFASTPQKVTGTSPLVYDVQAYDSLGALNQTVGDSYALAAGANYLTTIAGIFTAQGYTKFNIDTSRIASTLPSARGWVMGDNVTWLSVVNDLLASIGYRGVYSDWDGYLVCVPYQTPTERSAEWTYDDGMYTSQLGFQQTLTHDYSTAPNKWVGVRNSQQEGSVPTVGNGIFVYQNDNIGETSIAARGGLIRAVRLDLDVADQAALQTAVMAQATLDMMGNTSIEFTTTPNPLHFHFDILNIATADLGIFKVQENSWSLPLDGSMMTHDVSVIQ